MAGAPKASAAMAPPVHRDLDHDLRPDGKWLLTEVFDGFGIVFPFLPQGLDDFRGQDRSGTQRRTSSGRSKKAARWRKISACKGQKPVFEPVDAVSAAEQPFSAYLPLPGISGAKTTGTGAGFRIIRPET
jgi:hypothetical protein